MMKRSGDRAQKLPNVTVISTVGLTLAVLIFALLWKGPVKRSTVESPTRLSGSETVAAVEEIIGAARASAVDGEGTPEGRFDAALARIAKVRNIDADVLTSSIREWATGVKNGTSMDDLEGALQAFVDGDFRVALRRAQSALEQATTGGNRLLGYRAARLCGDTHLALGTRGEALADFQRAAAFSDRFAQPDLWVEVQQWVGHLQLEKGDLQEAEILLRSVVTVRRSQGFPQNRALPSAMKDLAEVLRKTQRAGNAIVMLRQALALQRTYEGLDSPGVTPLMRALGLVLWEQGETVDAEVFLARALKADEDRYGSMHPEVGRSLNDLAELYAQAGRLERALPMQERVAKIFESVYGANHAKTAAVLLKLGVTLGGLNRLPEAEDVLRRALVLCETSLGKTDPAVTEALNALGMVLWKSGKDDEVEPVLRRAVTVGEAGGGKDLAGLGRDLAALAKFVEEEQSPTDSEALWRRCAQVDEIVHGHFHSTVARDLLHLTDCLIAAKRTMDALETLRGAITIQMRLQADSGVETPEIKETSLKFLQLCRKVGMTDEAIQKLLSGAWMLGGLTDFRFPAFWQGLVIDASAASSKAPANSPGL